MILNKAYKIELDPNNKQRTLLFKHAGAKRYIYNWALSKKKQEYKETGKSSGWIEQSRQLTQLKKELPWLYEVSKCITQNALKDLDDAFKNFFGDLKNPKISKKKKHGYPNYKSKKKSNNSFKLNNDNFNRKTQSITVFKYYIKLPKFGKIKLKQSNYIPIEEIKILSAVCSERAGRWFVSVNCEVEVPDSIPAAGEPIGMDLGIKTHVVISDGRKFENPKALKQCSKKLAKTQRELNRRKLGGKNRKKSIKKVAKLHYKIWCIRRDNINKVTSLICARAKPYYERPSFIVMEDLNNAGMLQNHKIAKSLSDAAFGEIKRQMEYKCNWLGIKFILADRFYPSSKTCSVCGEINSNLTLKDREWTCPKCGSKHDRDLNAAVNLVKYPSTVGSTGINAYGDCVRPSIQEGNDRGNRNQTLSVQL